MRLRWIIALVAASAFGLLIALTGYADSADPLNVQDSLAVPAGTLFGSQTIGQTIVFRQPNLRAIQVRWVVSDDFACDPTSRAIFHLRHDVNDATDIATASVALNTLHHNDFTTFEFSPLENSQDQAYYFFLDVAQANITHGYVSVWASGEDVYPDGKMYLGSLPTDRDLVFQAFYAPDAPLVLRALGARLAPDARGIVFMPLIFLVPGLAFLLWLDFGKPTFAQQIALATGLSVTLFAALALIALAIGVSVFALVGVTVIASLVCGIGLLRRRIFIPHRVTQMDWLFIAFAALSFTVGLLQIRDLVVPAWVDSPTHAAYIKTFLEQGRLPLTEIYHLGYHGIVALLVQLAGISIPEAMLLVGQCLITQAGVGVFLLSKKISGDDTAALTAASVVWFLSPTPAYFITWGRYPLLLGVAILPVALYFLIELIEQPRWSWRAVAFAALTFAGLAFAQIRLIAFYVVFAVLEALTGLWRNSSAARKTSALRFGIIVGVIIGVGAVWLASLFGNQVGWQAILERNAQAPEIEPGVAVAVALAHHGSAVWWLAALGAIVAGLFRRKRGMLIVLATFGALYGLTQLLGVFVPPSLVVLTGFVLAAILVGELIGWLAEFTQARGIWLIALTLVSVLGARDLMSIVNPTTVLFTQADARAMTWVAAHTPADAQFLINSFAWSPPVYNLADGGAWLPYVAPRATRLLDPTAVPIKDDATALAQWIVANHITYIYLGRRGGVLTKTLFACDPARYAPLYDQEGVVIFEVKGTGSQSQSTAPSRFDCRK